MPLNLSTCISSGLFVIILKWLLVSLPRFCSLQVQNMANANASGVLIHTLAGDPIQDMNCVEDECNTTLQIPAAMVHPEPSVVEALQ